MILSGGAGTRLWPLSTHDQPKQFAPLLPDGSLFTSTLTRLDGTEGVSPPIVVTGAAHSALVTVAASEADVTPHLMIVEPEGRNTAPAAIAAASVSDPEDVLAILPSDHLIGDVEAFSAAVLESVPHAREGRIVTFGITPTRPETGYGYIELGEDAAGAYRVRRFKEKPDLEEAKRLVATGNHLWNSGIFVVMAQALIEEADLLCPEVLRLVKAARREPVEGVLELGSEFGEVEKISFDIAIMEKTERAVIMPIDVGWDDIGSFEALWSVSDKDASGNVVSGDAVLIDVEGSYVKATSRKVAVAGLTDVVVVETPDAVLVVPREQAQMVRDLARRLD